MSMCAIAGMIRLRSDETIRRKMLDTMARRGPDGEGEETWDECTLLHTRLAIIDPVGGHQPMDLDWAGERWSIVYNGELYNTEELRNELRLAGHSFHGHSDTEVVLHSYAQWGQECVHKFNGIFAFAVWEERKKRLFLARDRIGVKPLFFTRKDDGLIFASEIKTILAHPDIPAELDSQGAAEILLLGPGRTPGCGVFRNISEVEPGCCGYFENGELKLCRYWKLRVRDHLQSFEETAQIVRELVTDAIRRQTVSDVLIGTFLSGGLDSSLISAICARDAEQQGHRMDTFSVDYVNNDRFFHPTKFQPNSDSHYIRLMVDALDTDHHWSVLSAQALVDALEDAPRARDLPGMADVDFSLLLLSGDIRRHVKVALSGECADEIFGGYPWYRDPEIRDRDGFPWAQTTAWRAAFLHPDLQRQLSPEEYIRERYAATIRESDILPEKSPQERRMKEMVNLNFRWFMQTLLDRKDRMSMYHGLEVRVPFCDYRIAEYLYAVPWEFKDYHGHEKGLLRKAMDGILPEQVLWRKKSPYPKTFDPAYFELVRQRLRALLQQKNAPIFDLVKRDALEGLLTAEYAWPWYGQLMNIPQTIAYMLQIDFWLREYNVQIVS